MVAIDNNFKQEKLANIMEDPVGVEVNTNTRSIWRR